MDKPGMTLRQSAIGILSDVLLWGIVLAVLITAGRFLLISQPKTIHHGEQNIMLAFHDASQLQVGSPVDLMGTDIGYVTKVRADGTHVLVTFKTYSDALKIPPGSHFTIEFNGLAGAKTLEVIPPGEREVGWSQEGFHVYEPIRLRDVYKTQQVMAEALELSMTNLDQSLGSTSTIKTFPLKVQTLSNHLTNAYNIFDYTGDFIQHQSVAVPRILHNATRSINGFYNVAQSMERYTDPAYFKSNTMESMRGFLSATRNTYYGIGKAVSEKHVTQLRHQMKARNEQFLRMSEQIEENVPRIFERWTNFNNGLSTFDGWLTRIIDANRGKPLHQRLEDFQLKMHSWAEETNDLEKKLLKKESQLKKKEKKSR